MSRVDLVGELFSIEPKRPYCCFQKHGPRIAHFIDSGAIFMTLRFPKSFHCLSAM